MIKELATKKSTTVTGLVTALTGIIISLIPNEVWSTCSEAVFASGSPVMIGSLVAAGLALTLIGPSLAKTSRSKYFED